MTPAYFGPFGTPPVSKISNWRTPLPPTPHPHPSLTSFRDSDRTYSIIYENTWLWHTILDYIALIWYNLWKVNKLLDIPDTNCTQTNAPPPC